MCQQGGRSSALVIGDDQGFVLRPSVSQEFVKKQRYQNVNFSTVLDGKSTVIVRSCSEHVSEVLFLSFKFCVRIISV